MDTTAPEHARLHAAVTECLNAHDRLGVLHLGASEDGYDREMEDFVRLIAQGVAITRGCGRRLAQMVAASNGDRCGKLEVPTDEMEALAAELQAVQRGFSGP